MQHPPYLICVYASKFFGNAACYAHYHAVLHSLLHISTGVKMVTSWMSFCKTCVLAVALSMLLAGCSINEDATGASSDSVTSDSSSENGSAGGQKLAASLSEWIEQRESQGNIAESQKTILDKAKSTGEISTSDYEKAWSDYRQCMIDKGYKEIKLIKYPSGLYVEAGHKQGTTIQESRYSDDSTECGDEYVADVQDVYGIIVGNPNLYADQAQAVVDCLHRDSLVPKDYTVSRFNKEFSGTDGNTSFDMQNLQVRSCLVSNGYNVGYATDDTEQLW